MILWVNAFWKSMCINVKIVRHRMKIIRTKVGIKMFNTNFEKNCHVRTLEKQCYTFKNIEEK